MRKYTSKTQKIEMYGEKYNKTQEEMYRILTEHEALLTLDELKIKYDNENIGQLPQWLIDEGGYSALTQYIDKGINIKYDSRYFWSTKEEFRSEMYEFILKRIHLYKSGSNITSAVANRMVWLWRQHAGRGSYFPISLQDPIHRNKSKIDDDDVTYENIITKTEYDTSEDIELIHTINTIKNKQVRDVLIVIGYMVANIQEFKPLYSEVIKTLDRDVLIELTRLQKKLNDKYSAYEITQDNGQVINKNRIKVTAKDVLKAMKFNVEQISYTRKVRKSQKCPSGLKQVNIEQKYNINDSLTELQNFITNIGLVY